jgi:origin recognition complex subunit 1
MSHQEDEDIEFDSDDSIDFALIDEERQKDDVLDRSLELDEIEDDEPITPITPGFENNPLSKARAKLALSARPETLPCREREIERIYDALNLAVSESSPLTMYIAGEPGTGKTACVTKVVKRLLDEYNGKKLQYVFINAMKLSSPSDAFTKLHDHILKPKKKVPKREHRQRLAKYFQKKLATKAYTVVVIDELDFLVTRGQQEIYEFFNWPQLEHSRLAIVGIANTVTLPETLMPKIANRFQNTERIVFSTYSKDDIVKILTDRVKGLNAIEPNAIEMCAVKVARSSGDIRRGLDVCRRAAEIVGRDKTVTVQDIIDAYNDLFSSGTYPLMELSIYHKLFFLCAVKEQYSAQTNDLSFEKVVSRMQTQINKCYNSSVIENITIREALPICDCLEAMQVLTTTRSEAERFPIMRLNIEKELLYEKLKRDEEMEIFFE